MSKDRPDIPPPAPQPTGKPAGPPAADNDSPFRYMHDGGFVQIMHEIRASLLVSTYQAGKLMLVRAGEGRISTLLRSFEQPMGVAVQPSLEQIAVGATKEVWFLASCPDIAGQFDPPGRHDACYAPRRSHVTGDMRSHEMAFVNDELWIVNTRFSCLCTLDPQYSFVPRWMPPFITQLAAEDRCHLSGLAVDGDKIAYVTAHATSNEQQGWRENKEKTGIVIHVPTGEIVAEGLCMPHSPRLYDGKLYLLNSGRGQLNTLDPKTGKLDTIIELPGYTRGMAMLGKYAFIGLSKIRETAMFGGLPIAERLDELHCGIHVVDLTSGQTAGVMQFEAGAEELFDLQILPGKIWPAIVGFQKDTIEGIFIAPPESWRPRE